GENHFRSRISRSDVGDGSAIFCGTEDDRDFVAGLERSPCPAGSAQNTRAVGFDCPMHDLSVLVFHVQVDLRMRIGPDELRYGSFDRNSSLLVVGRISVM